MLVVGVLLDPSRAREILLRPAQRLARQLEARTDGRLVVARRFPSHHSEHQTVAIAALRVISRARGKGASAGRLR